MLIIPAIDLRHGRCVRLTQGRKETVKVYDAHPVEVAKRFEAAGAQMLHVVDLDRAFGERTSPNRESLRQIIRSVKIPVQFGGGVRDLDQVRELIDGGVYRIVIGSLAVEAPKTLAEILSLFGPSHVAVGIDARYEFVVTHGWQTDSAIRAIDLARAMAAIGVERIIYTDVERDGTLSGPNLDQTCLIASAGVKVTASGGVTCLQDLKDLLALKRFGLDSVIVGKALSEGRFSLPEALEVTAGGVDRTN